MTLDEAIKILNERGHRKANADDRWDNPWDRAFLDLPDDEQIVQGPDRYDNLEAFEAIAIAEKYQREACPRCKGRGQVIVMMACCPPHLYGTCPACGGTGNRKVAAHKDSGIACMVKHDQGGPCFICEDCGQHIRPDQRTESCPGRVAVATGNPA